MSEERRVCVSLTVGSPLCVLLCGQVCGLGVRVWFGRPPREAPELSTITTSFNLRKGCEMKTHFDVISTC